MYSRQPLFTKYDGLSARKMQVEGARKAVAQLSEDHILQSEIEALVQYYIEKFDVEVPVLDLENVSVSEHERMIERYDYTRIISAIGVSFDFEIPFLGDAKVFQMRPNSYDSAPPDANIQGNLICFSVIGHQVTEEEVGRLFEHTRDSIQKYLNWHRDMWAGVKDEIARVVRSEVEERRNRLLQQKQVASGLSKFGIKLKEKTSDPRTYVPPVIKQKIEPKLPPMRPSAPPEPTLEKQQYETMLSLIRGAGRSIEQSSSRTRSLDEEALRDMLLVPLNAHFGNATGEAFNCNGKTDLLIRHEGKNLFAAECKIWAGDKQLMSAIDQLLSYLHWRDTKAALVIFNRNKDFSGVIQKLKDLPKAHPAFISGPTVLDESSVQFIFKLPQDAARTVIISVLAFDLGA